MNTLTALKQVRTQTIGRAPVVVLPIKIWQAIESQLEELEMVNSQSLRKNISKARKEKKLYSAAQAKKLLGI